MLKILAYDYQVKTLPGQIEYMTHMGLHDGTHLTISICAGMDIQHQESTILHEILESIDWQLKLDLGEQKMLCLEIGLYNVLKNARVDLSPLLKELDL